MFKFLNPATFLVIQVIVTEIVIRDGCQENQFIPFSKDLYVMYTAIDMRSTWAMIFRTIDPTDIDFSSSMFHYFIECFKQKISVLF